MRRYILNVGAGRQHQRPRQAKMGEQRLALLGKQWFAIAEQRERHIAQRQPHHAAAGRVRADKAAQAGLGRHNGVPRLPRQLVAAAIAARDRVADAAGGDQRMRCAVCFPPVGDGTLADAVLQKQPFGAAAHKLSVPGIVAQCRQHIGGAIRLRKDPPPALGFKRYTESFKQFHRRRRRECVKAGIEEPPVAPHIGQKLPHIAVACEVAAPLAGDEQLLPRPLGVVFQHGHGKAAGTGSARRHQARSTAADDQ